MDLQRIPGNDGEWVNWTYTENHLKMGSGPSGPHRIPGIDGEWANFTYTEYHLKMGSGPSGPTQNSR